MRLVQRRVDGLVHILGATAIVERLLFSTSVHGPARMRIRLGRLQIVVEAALVLDVRLRRDGVVLVGRADVAVHTARCLLGASATCWWHGTEADSACRSARFTRIDLTDILHRVYLRQVTLLIVRR